MLPVSIKVIYPSEIVYSKDFDFIFNTKFLIDSFTTRENCPLWSNSEQP